jgi:hypothetical protein
MHSHRALLIGVLIPAAFTHALYSGLRGHGHVHRSWRYERSFSYSDAPARPAPPWVPGVPPVPPVAPAAPCDAPARVVRTFDASPARADRLELPGGIGALQVDHVSDLDHVEVEASACGALDLSLDRHGNVLRLEAPEGWPAGMQIHVSAPLRTRVLVDGEDVGRFGHRRSRRGR